METLHFLDETQVRELVAEFPTPFFVYDEETIRARAREVLAFPNAYGLIGRYAMKALPTAAILRLMVDEGLHIDASSGYEAERALRVGVPPELIQITAQEFPPQPARDGRAWRPLQCLLAGSAATLRRNVPGHVALGASQPGARLRPQQSHQCRRALRELRDLA